MSSVRNSLPWLCSCYYKPKFTVQVSNLIPDTAVVKTLAGQGESTAHAAPTVFCPFQKHYRKTRRTVQFLLSNGAKWSARN